MTYQSYQFSFDEVKPNVDSLADYLLLSDEVDYDLMRGTVDLTFRQLEDSKEIQGCYRMVDCDEHSVHDDAIILGETVLHTGKRITHYMRGATRLAFFICTAGERFTALSHQYQKQGDFLEAFVVESIGSATVENVADRIQQYLQDDMALQGLSITNRYSPGYCNWPLTDQVKLFSLIGSETAGVSLSPSCLMQPIKSVSGLIGVGPTMRKQAYGCAVCDSSHCIYRKINQNTPKL